MYQWFDCPLLGCGGFTGYYPAKRQELHWLSPTTRQLASKKLNCLSLMYISSKSKTTLGIVYCFARKAHTCTLVMVKKVLCITYQVKKKATEGIVKTKDLRNTILHIVELAEFENIERRSTDGRRMPEALVYL